MNSTKLLKGVLDAAVLAAVSTKTCYGDDVMRRLRDARLTEVGDASGYGTLRPLHQAGALSSYVVASDGGPHRQYYGLRPVGRNHLPDAEVAWKSFSSTVEGLFAASSGSNSDR